MRIESAKFGKRGVFYTGLLFFLTFALMCVIGSLGPDVFERKEGMSVLRINKLDTDKSVWIGNLVNLVPENQLIWVTCNIERPSSINASYAFDYKQKLVISVIGTDGELERNFDAQTGDLVVDEKVAIREVSFPPR